MKRVFYLLVLVFLAVHISVSCKKDDNDNGNGAVVTDPPVVTFKTGIYTGSNVSYTSKDTTLPVKAVFVFGFNAESKSDRNLTKLHVKRIFQGVALQYIENDTALDTKTLSRDIPLTAHPSSGEEEFRVVITDGYGKSDSISFKITTTMGDADIWVYTGIVLGSNENTSVNNGFAAVPGLTYSYAEALDSVNIQAQIDFMYANSAEWGHTLMSPNYIAQIYTWYPLIAGWTHKKSTDFARTMLSVANYNSVQTKNQLLLFIQQQGLVNMSAKFYSEKMSNPGGFVVGDIIAFRATPGKFGLLQITEITAPGDYGMSTIKFNVKVFK